MFLNETIHKKEIEFSKVIEEKSKKNEELQEMIRNLKAKIEKIEMDQNDRAFLRSGLGTVADISSSFQVFNPVPSRIADIMNSSPNNPDILGYTSKSPQYLSFAEPSFPMDDGSKISFDVVELDGSVDPKSSIGEKRKAFDDKQNINGQDKK